jgi:hypothetical protein
MATVRLNSATFHGGNGRLLVWRIGKEK